MKEVVRLIWSKNWMRWLLVLPASLTAWVLSGVAIGLIGMMAFSGLEDDALPSLKILLDRSLVEPAVFVTVGAAVAPRFRFSTAVVLATGFAVFIVFGLLGLVRRGSTDWRYLLAAVLSVTSLIWASWGFREARR